MSMTLTWMLQRPKSKNYLVSVHNVRLLRYACPKIAHLPPVNSAFPGCASLESEHYDSDTDFIDRLYLVIFENQKHE